MSDFMMKVEGAEEINALLAKLPANAKYGAALGMNRTMDEAQAKVKAGLSGKFTLRRKSFIENTIYRKPGQDFATKDKLEARIQVNPERDFLAKFEEGGDKGPTRGRKALGVPVLGGARPTKGAVVPERMKLKTLFFGQQGLLSQASAVFGAKRKGVRKGLLKASAANNVAVLNGKVYRIEGTKRNPKLKLLWVFKKAVRVRPVLKFADTARAVIASRAELNVTGAIDVEVTRGLMTKSGPTGG